MRLDAHCKVLRPYAIPPCALCSNQLLRKCRLLHWSRPCFSLPMHMTHWAHLALAAATVASQVTHHCRQAHSLLPRGPH